MKNKLILGIFALIICSSFISSAIFEKTYGVMTDTDTNLIQIESLRYDPYPVGPGEYFTFWAVAQKTGEAVKGASFKMEANYPFSQDSSEEQIKTFNNLPTGAVLLKYRIRVADDAAEGPNILKLAYQIEGSSWVVVDIEIEVKNTQTTFEGIIQDINEDSVSIAIANTGINDAKSVIIKLPEQKGYSLSGPNGKMIGTLKDGDYTIVSFDIVKEEELKDDLKLELRYTDDIGKRKTLELNFPASSFEGSVVSTNLFDSTKKVPDQKSNSKIYSGLIILAIVLIWAYRKRKLLRLKLSKPNQKQEEPEWLKKHNKK